MRGAFLAFLCVFAPIFRGASGLDDLLFAALRAFELDPADVARHTAPRPARALHILVRLVRAARLRGAGGIALGRPPAQERGILRAALGEVAREEAEEEVDAHREREIVRDGGEEGVAHEAGNEAQRQLADQQRPAQRVRAVAPVHEARQRAAELIEKVLQVKSRFLFKLSPFYTILRTE